MNKAEERHMKLAIEKALQGIEEGNSPFGSCIVAKDGRVLAVSHNTVISAKDPTRHAEINAIRSACVKLKRGDLSGCTVYSTTEPCPMCFSAIHWAKAERIVFGTSISDVKKLGFSELKISNVQMREIGGLEVEIIGDFMKDECSALLKKWKGSGKAETY